MNTLTFLRISKYLNLLSKSSPNVAPFLKLMKRAYVIKAKEHNRCKSFHLLLVEDQLNQMNFLYE